MHWHHHICSHYLPAYCRTIHYHLPTPNSTIPSFQSPSRLLLTLPNSIIPYPFPISLLPYQCTPPRNTPPSPLTLHTSVRFLQLPADRRRQPNLRANCGPLSSASRGRPIKSQEIRNGGKLRCPVFRRKLGDCVHGLLREVRERDVERQGGMLRGRER